MINGLPNTIWGWPVKWIISEPTVMYVRYIGPLEVICQSSFIGAHILETSRGPYERGVADNAKGGTPTLDTNIL